VEAIKEVAALGKRRRGFGAVYHRPYGRWEGQIRIPGGGRRSVYGRTRREAVHRLSEERWALGQGLPVSAGTTSLEAFLGRWLAITASLLRPSTVLTYTIDVQRFLPYLGRVPLLALTPGMIASTYPSLLKSGLSPRSVEQAHCVLHLALKRAMHWRIISGMRLGEALGLKWDDVDLTHGKLVVRRTLLRHPGRELLFAPPKTEKSRRTIHLSEAARKP
jgi:integrase